MDCKHIPYISVNQYTTDSNVFLCIGEGEEILNAIRNFPSCDCVIVENIQEQCHKDHLVNNLYSVIKAYIIFESDQNNATLFKLKYS